MRVRDRSRRVFFWAPLAVVFALALTGCDSNPKPSVKSTGLVLAEVNGDSITQTEVRAALMLKGADLPSKQDESLWRTLIEDLVERRLILQRSQTVGEFVDEARVHGLIQFITQQYGSPEELDKILLEEGIERKQWQKAIRETLTIEQVMNREVYSKIEPPEELIKDFYKKNVNRYRVKKRWRVRQIVVGSEDEAHRLRKNILGGGGFLKFARENSIGPNRDQAGDMGFFTPGELPSDIERVIRKLKGSDVSRVVQTPSGYHLFQVTERRLGGIQPFREVRETIRSELIADLGRRQLKKWLSELKEKAVIQYFWRNLRYVAAR